MKLRVAARNELSDGVIGFRLVDPQGDQLPAWDPGAHVDVSVQDGARQYSLCGDPTVKTEYRLAVLREPGGQGGSTWLHDSVKVGSLLEVGSPRNNFPLQPADKYIIIAGGIGITPLLPMLAAISRRGNGWHLTYGGRVETSMAFRAELVARYGDRVQIRPEDKYGLLDLDSTIGEPQEGTLIYCCGPEPLLAAVERHTANWPTGALHVERFAARPVDEPAINRPFTVVLARSNMSVEIAADQSILDALESVGIVPLSNCLAGTCGECETTVLGGIPDHRDSLLTEAEQQANDIMYPCVSRSLSDTLTLDI
jgi:ferredoxin-NADP reductase